MLCLSLGSVALIAATKGALFAVRESAAGQVLFIFIGLGLVIGALMAGLACAIFFVWSLWRKQWLSSLFALILPSFLAAEIFTEIPLLGGVEDLVRQIEFRTAKASYDLKVRELDLASSPRLLKVKDRYRGMCPWACGQFEEIWYDESDQFGSEDPKIRERLFSSMHPDEPAKKDYTAQPFGGHYYLIVYRN